MQIFRELGKAPIEGYSKLTIGTFDGMHLGHKSVFNRLKNVAPNNDTLIALSFSSHPLKVLKPELAHPLIQTIDGRTNEMALAGVDILYLLPFTKEFAQLSSECFLSTLKELFHFSHLILGHDAIFGKNREGNPEKIKELAQKLSFIVEYLPPVCDEEGPISSTRIRAAILAGNLKKASSLLGRPFSYTLSNPLNENGIFTYILSDLCVPPAGVYAISCNDIPGVAKIDEKKLQCYFFGAQNEPKEIILHHKLNESHFPSLDSLQVKVIFNAQKNQIVGWENEVLKVRIAEIPEKGKVNNELVSFLTKKLRPSKSQVNLIHGETSQKKTLRISY